MPTLQSVFPSRSPDPAIIVPATGSTGPVVVSFDTLSKLVGQARKFIASLDLAPGSAIAIALPNSLEFVVLFFAVSYSGYIAAPLNPALKQSEFEFYLADLSCPVAFVPKTAEREAVIKAAAKSADNVRIFELEASTESINVKTGAGESVGLGSLQSKSVSEAKADDVALVLHTSGTTGRPKIVPLTHTNLATSISNIVQTYKLTKADRSMLVMPLFHVHGLLCGFLAPLSVASGVIVPLKFSAHSFWKDFVELGANWYTAVPTIHQILLKSPSPFDNGAKGPNVRFIRSCSSALAPATMKQLEERFKAPVLEAYAMTEASHQMTSNDLPPGKRKSGSVGRAQGVVKVAILDQEGNEVKQGGEGEICVKGANVTKGYRNNEAANKSSFTASGFFRTGDQGKLDADGFVYITGRIKELINRGGEKISPLELDALMLEIPEVAEAVSFAVPDEMYGQEVHATVVVKPGAKLSEGDVKKFMSERVAKFKVPKRVYFTETMPKTATGKIQRKNISETFFKPEGEVKAKAKL
ncbi:hypothetical protein BZA70DRAFT_233486 [Myxozyma melibiosi]|uniref:Peroxisomal-coenzyme A synthetase n=1 Tax=Myxozyma melibiosi TaxID=54550 RepID=A0ABR1FDP4_9ASCO